MTVTPTPGTPQAGAYQALLAALGDDGSITLTPSLLPQAAPVLAAMGYTSLSLTAASVSSTQSATGAVVTLTGTSTIFGEPATPSHLSVSISEDDAADLRVVIAWTIPAGWILANGFPFLPKSMRATQGNGDLLTLQDSIAADLVFASGEIVSDTRTSDTLTITGRLESLATLTGLPPTVTIPALPPVAGTITQSSSPAPLLTLDIDLGQVTVSAGPLTLSEVHLQVDTISLDFGTEWECSYALAGTVTLGGRPFTVSTPLYATTDVLSLTASFEAGKFPIDGGLDDLVSLFGFPPDTFAKPPGLSVLDDIDLLAITLEGGAQEAPIITRVTVVVGTDNPWEIFAGVQATSLVVGWTIDDPFDSVSRDLVTNFEACLQIGSTGDTVEFDVLAQQSCDWNVWGVMKPENLGAWSLPELARVALGWTNPPDLPALELLDVAVEADTDGDYSVTVVVGNWHINDAVTLVDVTATIEHAAGETSGRLGVDFLLGGALLKLVADIKSGDGGYQLVGDYDAGRDPVTLTDIAEDLGHLFGVSLPAAVPPVDVTAIHASLTTGADNFAMTLAVEGTATVADGTALLALTLHVTKDSAEPQAPSTEPDDPAPAPTPTPTPTYAIKVGGKLTLGDDTFTLSFDDGPDGSTMQATIAQAGEPTSENESNAASAASGPSSPPSPASNIAISTLVSRLSPTLGALLPGDLELPVKALAVLHVTEAPNVPAHGYNEFGEVVEPPLEVSADAAPSVWVVSSHLGVNLGLSSLPVVGRTLASGQDVTMQDLVFTWTSRTLTETETRLVSKALGTPQMATSNAPLAGIVLGLQVGALNHQASLPLIAAPVTPPPPGAPPAPPAQAPGGAFWLPVQLDLGPLSLQRVGVQYADGKILVLLDAGFALSAFALDLLGLGVGLTPHLPTSATPELAGMGIQLIDGPVSITGALVRVEPTDGTPVRYDGIAGILVAELAISAYASYTTLENAASLFGFAVAEEALGGPPFAFVTAVAVGFGANRDFLVPTLDQLPNLPLIQAVSGYPAALGAPTDVAGAVEALAGSIPPKYGSDWLAAGVRLTTFNLIESGILAVAKFSGEIEFDIVGLSVLSVPAGDPNPIGFAELAVEASYKPSDGVIAVDGTLTPSSFVLEAACHLTGAFAFRAWLTDNPNGASAGDMVTTLGGYHPDYQVPSWYPQVPRLGVSWHVDDNMSVTGGLYFALTPNAVMAGGELDAVWSSSGLSAWFSAYADFLLSWQPFYYSADLDISVGASYTLNLWVTSVTVTVHVGVDLTLHGPSFGGSASVYLYVATITIRFGADSDVEKEPITWEQFKSGFLPPEPTAPTAHEDKVHVVTTLARPVGADIPTQVLCFSRVSGGLSKTLNPPDAGVQCVVNPETFRLETTSVIPITNAVLQAGEDPGVPVELGTVPAFGIGPVNIPDGSVTSTHTVTVSYTGQETFSATNIMATPLTSNVPAAPWKASVAFAPDAAALNTEATLITDVVTGVALTPVVPDPDRTATVDLSLLQYGSVDESSGGLTPPTTCVRVPTDCAAPIPPTTDNFDQTTADEQVASSIDDAEIGASRTVLLAGLRQAGVAVAADVTVNGLRSAPTTALRCAPVLSHLGEQPATEGTQP